MVLWLNSTFADHVEVALTQASDGRPRWESVDGRDALAAAAHALKAKRKKISDLSGVVVVAGPGPFSRVRAGVAIANTLSFSLGIPLWALRAGKPRRVRGVLAPVYGAKPNITKTKNLRS